MYGSLILLLFPFSTIQRLRQKSTAVCSTRDADAAWQRISAVLDDIHAGRPRQRHSISDLYRQGYLLVKHKYGPMYYSAVEHKIRVHLQGKLEELLQQHPNHHNDKELCHAVARLYTQHQQDTRLIQDVCLYMDRAYVASRQDLPTVGQLSVRLFRTIVWEPVRGRVIKYVHDTIQTERVVSSSSGGPPTMHDEDDHGATMTVLLQMLVAMTQAAQEHVYHADLEHSMVQHTVDYYRTASLDWCRAALQHPLAYVARAVVAYRAEHERAVAWGMLPTTQRALQRVLREELLERHMDRLALQEFQI